MALSAKSKIEELSTSLDTANRVMVVFLVIAAVAAAVVAVSTFLVIRWQGRLDGLKEVELTQYKLNAGKKVSEADSKADAAKADAARSNLAVAKAGERIAELDKETAKANARAAEAQLALAQFKAPRSIDQADFQKIVQALMPFGGQSVSIFVLEGQEPAALGLEISNILASAHLQPTSWVWSGIGSVVGVFVTFKPGSGLEIQNRATKIAAAFGDAHIAIEAGAWPGKWDEFGGMLGGPPFDAHIENIRILVGTKPPQ